MSPQTSSVAWVFQHPRKSLVILFSAWKLALMLIAHTSPGPGYDTSTLLLITPDEQQGSLGASHSYTHVFTTKLIRWDAIYFTRIANRGAIFEQEWAFGWGYTVWLNLLSQRRDSATSRGLVTNVRLSVLFGPHGNELSMAVAGIITANVSHLLSVLLLYQMSILIAEHPLSARSSWVAFISASLHILSPAGLFLSAPYAESPFSLLNFAGYFFYAASLKAHQESWTSRRDALITVSGFLFGLATTFRSNGLLSGLVYGVQIIECAMSIVHDRQLGRFSEHLRRMTFVVVAGSIMAVISFYPQYVAYQEYCIRTATSPPWCTNRVPSIYAWVQSRYCIASQASDKVTEPSNTAKDQGWISSTGAKITRHLAVPQMALALLAVTTYHVQIVNRISSGYPLWYWWLASKITSKTAVGTVGWEVPVKAVVGWLIPYGLIQAGLFAAFLPPA
ncbi:MAG: hypothetical protein Q9220_004723 [cf. Caloplaca sp. 1 TL-2023]